LRIEQGEVGWGGRLENKTNDHVTTWIMIAVIVFDADGKEKEVFAETPIWIDPMGEADFEVVLPELEPEQFEKIDFCGDDNQSPKACFAWAVAEVKGLAI
jgi:hypothetical protein